MDNKNSKGKLVHKICKEILVTKMETYNRREGRGYITTPDEFYGAFISTTAGLYMGIITWYITLCNPFFDFF